MSPTGNLVFGAKLLRWVWQRRSNDVGGRVADVLFPDPQAERQEAQVQIPRNGPNKSLMKNIKLIQKFNFD